MAIAFERVAGRQPRVEHDLAGRGALDDRREIQIDRALQDVTARARLERLPDERVLRVHAQDDDLRVGSVAQDRPRRGDAVHPGHRIVDEHDLRTDRLRQANGFVAVARLADHDDRGIILENPAEPAADERMVVGEQHGNRRVGFRGHGVSLLKGFGSGAGSRLRASRVPSALSP